MSLTYSHYLKIDELLSLQQPLSEGPEHDETLFIIIHQVYELWFKQILHELGYLAQLFREHSPSTDSTPAIRHTLERVLTILKTMVAQVDILETMTPMSFNSFRTRLETASGFQSPQFRELEFLLGLRDRRMVEYHRANPAVVERLLGLAERPSLYQDFLCYVRGFGYDLPDELIDVPRDEPLEHDAVHQALLRVYRENDRLSQICERLIDFDEGLQEWRYRHVKMVERTLGKKSGTGGSSGVDYLKSTLFQPIFPDLWTIRSEL